MCAIICESEIVHDSYIAKKHSGLRAIKALISECFLFVENFAVWSFSTVS